MPLGLVECMADVRPGRDILSMRDVRPMAVMSPVATGDVVKMALAAFMAEVLGLLLRERTPDEHLFDFVASMAAELAAAGPGVANFHLMFLYRLSRFLGVEPDVATYAPGRFFDMREGVFRILVPIHADYLSPQEGRVVVMLSRMRSHNLHRWRLNRNNRNDILDHILDYYARHLGVRTDSMSSLAVLRTLF